MADAGVSLGLSREQALQMAAQTFKGAASMVLETGEHPAHLRDAVCSPGGSTIAGVNRLEQVGLRGDIIAGVEAAYKRTKKWDKRQRRNRKKDWFWPIFFYVRATLFLPNHFRSDDRSFGRLV